MMLRRLLPGIWRRREVDDQDDVAVETAATTSPLGVRHKRGHRWPEQRQDRQHPNEIDARLDAKIAAKEAEKRRVRKAQEKAPNPLVIQAVSQVGIAVQIVSEQPWTLAGYVSQRVAKLFTKPVAPKPAAKPAKKAYIPPAAVGSIRAQSVGVFELGVWAGPPPAVMSLAGESLPVIECAIVTKRYGPQKILEQLKQIALVEL